MSRATRGAKDRERASTDGGSRFLQTKAFRPIPLKERAGELNLARKIYGKKRSKKNLEGLYEVLAPGSHILKVSPKSSTIKEPGKPIVTVPNSDIAKFGTQLERQTPLKWYANRREPRSSKKSVDKLTQCHMKEYTRKQKGDKKMKHRKRDPGSGVPSSKSNISYAMRGRIPKMPNFLAIQNPQPDAGTISNSEQLPTALTNTSVAAAHPTRTSDRNRRRTSYYGFESTSRDSTIVSPPKRPRRVGDVENVQPPPESIVESVQHIAESQPAEINISPRIGEVSHPPRKTLPSTKWILQL